MTISPRVQVTREEALMAAAEVLVDIAVRVETEKALAAAAVEPTERAA
ncbi:hypothetical protein JNB62_05590 [Microbacterium jejuense]|uniref:Uncharacterized protein n=1 Tax=Microbacterium jejuense TaxID=1263637 RepID=A0ABS7HL21_9MICO|nr:hypothetical protein [Microbacterium jejuense]MBW9093149.1 hypothetical protein [Microbacterium jejuense]